MIHNYIIIIDNFRINELCTCALEFIEIGWTYKMNEGFCNELQVLVALQAALTVIGNFTMCIAAYRIYKSSSEGSKNFWMKKYVYIYFEWMSYSSLVLILIAKLYLPWTCWSFTKICC